MARITGRPTVELKIVVELSEAEAGALDALAGYGTDAFLQVFYKHMGESYLKPYESGLRSLFESITALRHEVEKAKEARAVFTGQRKSYDPQYQEPTPKKDKTALDYARNV